MKDYLSKDNVNCREKKRVLENNFPNTLLIVYSIYNEIL